MVEPNRLPVQETDKTPAPPAAWQPVDDLRREIDRLFDDFGGAWLRPLRSATQKLDPIFRSSFSLKTPAVDLIEKDTAFELTAELPGIAAKDVDVSMKDGFILIKGQKQAEKEEKSKGYYLSERQYGSFERAFAVPDGVDTSAVEATFNNGVLTITLPKTMEAQKPAKTIEVKTAH
jgi:HSP20 family protein